MDAALLDTDMLNEVLTSINGLRPLYFSPDDEIAEIEKIALARADLTRPTE